MAEDREVLREVWQGKIPACFNLAQDDVYTMAIPEPYYLMLPRLSYAMLVTDKIKKHFSKFVHPDRQDSEMWFDFEGVPLKWHLPIGLIYDQMTLTHRGNCGLPWIINVHFGNFPADQILKYDSRESIESHFMSCIKEADQIKHGGRVISSMQKKDHNQLWQGLQNDKFDQFWAVNRRLMETGEGDGFKNIPVRLYVKDRPLPQKLVKSFVTIESDDENQSPVKTFKRPTTIFDLIQDYLPKKSAKNQILVHGIQPDLETPLQWLSEHCSYPDNFLHICIDGEILLSKS